MMIEKSTSNKHKSIYRCDRCLAVLTSDSNYRIFMQKKTDKYPQKKWDFCENCYKSLVRGVKKGREKNGF